MSQPVAQNAEIGAQATVTGLLVAHELKFGEVVAGRFRIESLLGIGGMGVVYRARDLSLDIDVAIKLLRPELARKPEAFERFRNELLLARQVSSPHVVRIHDIAQHGERWLISMDFIDGESLEHRLERQGPLQPDAAVALARGLLAGLVAAHQCGVIHRDLKPANILFDRNDRAYITDFGVARSLGATGVTQTGLIIGTPEYLSPEQARGETLDGRSDLYTVGLILYEALSGSLPFAGGTPAETVMRRLVRPPPSLAKIRPELPAWLHAFDDRLLKLVPGHRFASAEDALRALEQQRVPRPPVDRRRLLLVLLALVGAWGMLELGRRQLPVLLAAPPPAVAVQVARVAVLPLVADSSDQPALELARAVEEHLRDWLRSDAGQAVATRERTLAAVARAAPDLADDALRRRLPELARAAGVDQLWRGTLRHEGELWKLELLRSGTEEAGAALQAEGADAAALFADYRRVLAAAPSLQSLPPPPLADASVTVYGKALLALDGQQPARASEILRALPAADLAASALLQGSLLQAQIDAHEEVLAETTREQLRRAAAPNDLAGRQALALALDGADMPARLRLLETSLALFPHDAELAIQTAQALADAGQGERALRLLEQRVAADSQDARAWFLLGRIEIQQGQAHRAVDDYLLRALVLWTRAGDARAEAETRNALGVGYERLGQLEAAVEQYTRAAEMRGKLGDGRGQATSLRNLAVVQAVRGDRVQAEATLDKAKLLLEALNDRASIADLHNDRGVVAEERGDFRAALAAYREALALRQQLNAPALAAQSLNNVAFCYFQLGEVDNAAVYWQQALALYQQIDDREGALHVVQSMGLLELSRGHYAAAGQRLDASLREAEDLQLPEEIAVAQVYRGELALAEGRSADVLAAGTAAVAGFERRADQRGLAEARLLLARAGIFLGDAAGAETALSGLAEGELSLEQKATALLAKSRLARLRGDVDAASTALVEAERLAGEAHNAALLLESRIEQAAISLQVQQLSRADTQIAELVKEAGRRGQAPLRLAVIVLELRRGLLDRGDAAIARYREAQVLLRQLGRWQGEAELQSLGARLLARAGNRAEAAAAEAAAGRARSQLLQAAPASLRGQFEQVLASRLGEISDGHGS
ncbi:serine/threonine protein kinase [Tahibacter aquaticus]|uniref:non-specific serine/threonine protein kinase n=1 Tax=Tahibacter aquaticus TaxID=520092 RepID=A0A4R6YWP0_9GAMM|nr:serine/threonine-protein kinase [Tahibacter aquaticus]TDR43205.1 serine/threonine protein kinase [Tahibacter aquaticus]